MSLLLIGSISIVLVLSFLLPENLVLKRFNFLLNNNLGNYSLRNISINHIDQIYMENNESKTFIKLLIFNIKDYKNYIYKDIVNLNIIHLFVVSGLHVSLFVSLIKKIFKKFKLIGDISSIIIVILIFHLTGFSISILRILLTILIRLIFKKINSLEANIFAALLINIFFYNDSYKYGYYLSVISTLFIVFIVNKVKSKIIIYILINIATTLVLLPITLMFNEKINIFYFFNSILLSNLIIILFFIEILFVWIPPFSLINNFMIHNILNLFNNLSDIQIFIKLKSNYYVCGIWYTVLFASSIFFDREFIEWSRKDLFNLKNKTKLFLKLSRR